MRIGIFGGMFDPPHLGHLVLAEFALDELQLDQIIFIPTGTHALKNNTLHSSGIDRLQMTKLATQGNPRFSVSDIEVSQNNISYTSDTLQALKKQSPDRELFLLVGADNIAIFDQWHNTEKILELATIAVYGRNAKTKLVILESLQKRLIFLSSPLIEISSTNIRERVSAHKSITYLTTQSVQEYIRTHNLYAS